MNFKKILIALMVLMLGILLLGCGEKSLPSDEQIKKDLIGKKLTTEKSDKLIIEKIVSLKVTSKQNNYSKNKTAKFMADLEFTNETKKQKVNLEAEVNYYYYDEGGWSCKEVFISNKKEVNIMPTEEIKDEDVLSSINQVPCYADSEKLISGKVSKSAYEYFTLKNIKSKKVTNKTYNKEKKSYIFSLDIEASSNVILNKGKYEVEVNMNFPGYKLNQAVSIEQNPEYICPTEFTAEFIANRCVFLGSAEITLDSNKKPKEGIFKYKTGDYSFKFIPEFDNKAGTLYLKSDSVIKGNESYKPIDFKLKFSTLFTTYSGKAIDPATKEELDVANFGYKADK